MSLATLCDARPRTFLEVAERSNGPLAMPIWRAPHLPIEYRTIPGGPAGTRATMQAMADFVRRAPGDPNTGGEFVDWCRAIVRPVGSKQYVEELDRIFRFVKRVVRYRLDPMGVERVQTPYWTLAVDGQGDCFVAGTRVLLRDGHRLAPIETLRAGDEVWGLNRWSRVERTWDRGVRATWRIALSNGSSMRLTPEHLVWVGRCEHGPRAKPCSCPMSERKLERIAVEDLRPGDALTQPERVPCGAEALDSGRAYVEGLYLSEGWSDSRNRFSISGRDGHPREEQKREVEETCRRLGLRTRWHARYITVNDREWTQRIRAMGSRAPEKRALSLDYDEVTTRELVRGLLADSGRNTHGAGRTFSTTSASLWVQLRVMLKALGVTCSTRYLSAEEHGGLGTHGIWRMGLRSSEGLDGIGKIHDKIASGPLPERSGRRAGWLLRVKAIERDGLEAPCFDIATDDHCVWLPEADWTTSQCDDMGTLLAGMSLALGHGAVLRAVKVDPNRPQSYSHVYAILGCVVKGKTIWLPADATQRKPLGWQPPEARWTGDPLDVVVATP